MQNGEAFAVDLRLYYNFISSWDIMYHCSHSYLRKIKQNWSRLKWIVESFGLERILRNFLAQPTAHRQGHHWIQTWPLRICYLGLETPQGESFQSISGWLLPHCFDVLRVRTSFLTTVQNLTSIYDYCLLFFCLRPQWRLCYLGNLGPGRLLIGAYWASRLTKPNFCNLR